VGCEKSEKVGSQSVITVEMLVEDCLALDFFVNQCLCFILVFWLTFCSFLLIFC